MEQFNKLTFAQQERLAILSEELSEAIQIVGKILRHGYDSYNPNDPEQVPNKILLEEEIGHVYYAVEALVQDKTLNSRRIINHAGWKAKRVVKYLHHNSR